MALTYNPNIFDVPDVHRAKRIILTPEGATTELRWQIETPYVADLINQAVPMTAEMLVLDYGCGIGRMSKALIERHQCTVVGVDISPQMLRLSQDYVNSSRFLTCSPTELDVLVQKGLRFDAAISIWVLQHCLTPATDISRIWRSLRDEARVFILNNLWRAVPAKEQPWVNDGLNIKMMLEERFQKLNEGRLPPEKTTESLAQMHFWASFENHLTS